MQKVILFPLLCFISTFYGAQTISGIYDYSLTTIDGEIISMSSFKGKKLLLVNTASYCGFTPQFKALEKLNTDFREHNLVIIGFPCNDFAKQDPGNNKEIKSFCEKNYGVTFLMTEKVHVKGDSIAAIYDWLTRKSKNGVCNSRVVWNFQKYLIDEEGRLTGRVSPWKKPDCRKIRRWLNKNQSSK